MTAEFQKNRVLFLFAVFAFSILPAFAQTSKNAEIRRIDAYVKTLDAFVKRNKRPHLIFADTSDYNEDSKPKWRRFASEKALNDFRDRSETYSIAYNWRRGGKLVRSNFTLFSPSGDWAQYDYYSFRADGSLARIASELRTFYGDLIVLRDFYFDARGRLLRRTVRYRDLNTRKPVAKPSGKDFQTTDVTVYKTVRRLPFARLLK